MFRVKNIWTNEVQCDCASYTKAVEIAHALRVMVVADRNNPRDTHFAVFRGDEIMFDTINGASNCH